MKLSWASLALAAVVGLTACGSGSTEAEAEKPAVSAEENQASDEAQVEESVFVLEQDGGKSTLTYAYVGDRVVRQDSHTEFTYEGMGFADQDEARAALDPIAEEYRNTKGVEHSIEYGDDLLVESLSVDLNVADPQEVPELSGATATADTEGVQEISFKESKAMLLGLGYEEVE